MSSPFDLPGRASDAGPLPKNAASDLDDCDAAYDLSCDESLLNSDEEWS